jgi:hypothetical protein
MGHLGTVGARRRDGTSIAIERVVMRMLRQAARLERAASFLLHAPQALRKPQPIPREPFARVNVIDEELWDLSVRREVVARAT